MKKLITLSFLSFLFLFGNAQVTGVTVVDISDAVKVADFPDVVNVTVRKHNNQYYSLSRGADFYGYYRKDTIGSEWKFVDFPDSIQLSTFFFDGKWMGINHSHDVTIINNQVTTFNHSSKLYYFDFDTGEIHFFDELFSCGSIERLKEFVFDDKLYLLRNTACRGTMNFYEKANGYCLHNGVWETLNNLDYFPVRTSNERFFYQNIEDNEIYLSDTISISNPDTLLMRDTMDLQAGLALFEFQDTIYIFPGYKDYFYKTGDFGTTWTTLPLPYIFRSSSSFHEGYVFYSGIRDAIAYSLEDNSYYSILPDSLLLPYQGISDLQFENDEILGDFQSKGGLVRSLDRGKTWKGYMDGLPRIGLSNIQKFDGTIYGDNGNWSSVDGENWSPLRFGDGIPVKFAAKNDIALLATINKNSTETFLYKKEINENWGVCDTLEHPYPPEIYVSKENITYSQSSKELKSGSTNCSDWRVISNEGTELSFDNFEIVIKDDSLLSVGYDRSNYSLLRSFDFGNTWTTLNYVPVFSDDFFILNNSIVRTNYRNGEIWFSKNWGEFWQKSATYFPALTTSIFLRPNKEFLTTRTQRFYLISSNLGKDWIALDDENILDFEFLEDSTMLISKNDGVYTMDGREILDSLDSFKNQDVSSISETQLDSKINVYPNPVSDILTIKIEDINSEIFEVNLLNQLGQIISKHPIKSISKTHQVKTDRVPKGMFFVEMKFSDGRHSIKKVVKN